MPGSHRYRSGNDVEDHRGTRVTDKFVTPDLDAEHQSDCKPQHQQPDA
ncbi:hypothetical protein [Umezawaea sp. Da 62-37]|nr:hypothetical protein [Umezawaea sp. Da 62-37]WNV83912.1 hypothetical protein RM788_37970 [Umezawaea sp. Da 62-37]